MTNEASPMAPDRKRLLIVAAIVAVAVAGSGGWLYARLAERAPSGGTPAAAPPHPTAGMPAPAPGAQGVPNVPSIDVVAEKLAKRLAEKDGTADDWALLARSFREMKRYPEALDAYARAMKKAPDNAAFAAEAADVRKTAGIPAPR